MIWPGAMVEPGGNCDIPSVPPWVSSSPSLKSLRSITVPPGLYSSIHSAEGSLPEGLYNTSLISSQSPVGVGVGVLAGVVVGVSVGKRVGVDVTVASSVEVGVGVSGGRVGDSSVRVGVGEKAPVDVEVGVPVTAGSSDWVGVGV